MRGVYILSGKPAARVEKGVWLDSKGKAIGFDLWVELGKGRWLPAARLSSEEFAAIKDQLEIGIYHEGRLFTYLEPTSTLHKLIALKSGLTEAFQQRQNELKGVTSFKAFQEQIGNPLDRLIRQLERIKQQIEELKTIEGQERQAALEALKARVKRLKKKAAELPKEEQQPEAQPIKPEDVQPTDCDFLFDITRAWKGKVLSTESLELLCRAQRISEYASLSENSALLLDPERMRALRSLLVSK